MYELTALHRKMHVDDIRHPRTLVYPGWTRVARAYKDSQTRCRMGTSARTSPRLQSVMNPVGGNRGRQPQVSVNLGFLA